MMPVTSEWHNSEKTILHIRYVGAWTLDDYYRNFDIANELLRSVDHNVITLLDFSDSGQIPMKFLTVGNHAEQHGAKNNIQMLVFGLNRYLEMVGGLFQRTFPKAARGMRIVGSLEEALETAYETLRQEVR